MTCDGATTTVPAAYQAWVAQAAKGTGLPASVVAAQISCESSYNPNALSPTGAEGIAQFEPGTWSSYGTGSPYNPQDALLAYIKLMTSLLKSNNGNVADALAAYNAGQGNLSAGMGYANGILAAANANPNIKVTPGSGGNAPQTGGANQGTSGCADGFPVFFGFGSECVMSKAQALKLFGYVIMAAGGIVGMAGLVLLAVGGLKSTGATQGIHKAASTLAKPIEKLTPVGRMASTAQKHATKHAAKKAVPAGKKRPLTIQHYPEAKRGTPLTSAAAQQSRQKELHNQNVVPF